jgi:16S rRNA (adenine1518-N6/adenine1519-N6)-dimethyltransferase
MQVQSPSVQTLTDIRQLLAERGLRPKHRLGQNFLHDKNQLTKLLDAAHVKAGDIVLEVGPGTGTLTSALLERGAHVVACELDDNMARIIEDVFSSEMSERMEMGGGRAGSLTLIRGDALERGGRLNSRIIAALGGREFKLVANLPYQIASQLIASLLVDHDNCVGEFVTIQKEVADRILARPGTKEYGPLSIIVQALADVRKIGTLSPSCFWPAPQVTSAMVAIVPLTTRRMTNASDAVLGLPSQRRAFNRFVVDLFSKRRKQLGTIFGRGRTGWPAGISPQQRPDSLTVSQVVKLAAAVDLA